MPIRKPVLALFALTLMLVGAVSFFGGGNGAAPRSPTAESSAKPRASSDGAHAKGDRRGAGNSQARVSVMSASNEILYSLDLRATYEKYKTANDPNGDIAFWLSSALDDCLSFVDKTVDEVKAEMNSVGKVASNSPTRTQMIERAISRCRGFKEWGSGVLMEAYDAQRAKAVAVNHPGAVASTLATNLRREGTEKQDAKAIELLSGRIDESVLKGVFDYLSRRNGKEWLSQYGGEPATMTAAWAILQCNYGAPCDGASRVVVMGCIYYAACEQQDVVAVLLAMYPSLTPQKVDEAASIAAHIVSQIQNREWARIGFSESGAKKSP